MFPAKYYVTGNRIYRYQIFDAIMTWLHRKWEWHELAPVVCLHNRTSIICYMTESQYNLRVTNTLGNKGICDYEISIAINILHAGSLFIFVELVHMISENLNYAMLHME